MNHKMNLRCFARHRDGLWQAVCIDLNLAAQDKKLEKAKQKLHAQIVDYVNDACTVDKAHFKQLMNRKAPIPLRLEYCRAYWYQKVSHATDVYRRFIEPMPPVACA